MKLFLIIFGITAFLMVNTYYDGKYTSMLRINKKYTQMAMYGFVGLSLYIFMKRHPGESKNMFMHASDLVKYMPIEKNTSDMLGPLFDLTNLHSKLTSHMPSPSYNQINTPQMKRMVNSGKNTHSRSVSETKKKYVASEQKWKCGYCGDMLDATFEVDHKIDLQYGGTNHVSNLVASCVTCHKKKTMMNKINE
uniref:HNH nuclease domain-containing protein n=1 Tax=viral metagenome TaxID=1070528 RepID=A0A6C0CMT8_9ZZZZ